MDFRWQLDGHGGEEGTLVVEAFPKLCLVAGEQMIEVRNCSKDGYISNCFTQT